MCVYLRVNECVCVYVRMQVKKRMRVCIFMYRGSNWWVLIGLDATYHVIRVVGRV